MQTVRFISILSLFLGLAVLVNSVHGKDLLTSPQNAAARAQAHDDGGLQKIQSELHNHIDKAGKVLNDSPQTDTRSLRILQHSRRSAQLTHLNDLLRSWRQHVALHLA